jgi:hypothetical protein
MENHESHPPSTESMESIPNESFSSWVRKHSFLYNAKFASVILLLLFISTQIYYSLGASEDLRDFVKDYLKPTQVIYIINYLNIIIFLIFAIVLLRGLDDNDKGSYRTSEVYKKIFHVGFHPKSPERILRSSKNILRRFKLFLCGFCFSMIFLHIMLITHDRLIISDPNNQGFPKFLEVTHCAIDVCIVCNSMFIFWCYSLFNSPPFDAKRKKEFNSYKNISTVLAIVLCIVFVPVLLSAVKSESDSLNFNLLFHAIISVVYAIILALFFARFDSKLIGHTTRHIGLLYIYSAIQPLFILYELLEPNGIYKHSYKNEWSETLYVIYVGAMAVSFFLKVYFLLFIQFSIDTGKILNYIFCLPILQDAVEAIFGNHYEISIIRHDLEFFCFQIKDGNSLVYMTDKLHENRDDCKNSVMNVRKLLRHRSSYFIRDAEGTYWIEILNAANEVMCFSANLRSKKEAEEFILESMDKIPHCKFNYANADYKKVS